MSVQDNYYKLGATTRVELIINFVLTCLLLAVALLQIKAEGSRQRLRRKLQRQGQYWIKDQGDGHLSRRVRRAVAMTLVFKWGPSTRLLSSSHAVQALDWTCSTLVSFLLTGILMLIGCELAAQAEAFAEKNLQSVVSNSSRRAGIQTLISMVFMTGALAAAFILDRKWLFAVIYISFSVFLLAVIAQLWVEALKIHNAVTKFRPVTMQELKPPVPISGRSCSQISNTSDYPMDAAGVRSSITVKVAKSYSSSPIKRFFTFLIFVSICACLAEAVAIFLTLDNLSSIDKPFFAEGDDLYAPPVSGVTITQFIAIMIFLWHSWGGLTWRRLPACLLTPHLTNETGKLYNSTSQSPPTTNEVVDV